MIFFCKSACAYSFRSPFLERGYIRHDDTVLVLSTVNWSCGLKNEVCTIMSALRYEDPGRDALWQRSHFAPNAGENSFFSKILTKFKNIFSEVSKKRTFKTRMWNFLSRAWKYLTTFKIYSFFFSEEAVFFVVKSWLNFGIIFFLILKWVL